MREIHTPELDCGADKAQRRLCRNLLSTLVRTQQACRLHVPAGCAAALENSAGKCDSWPCISPPASHRSAGIRKKVDSAGRTGGLCRLFSASVERRHAQTRRDGPEL